MCVRSKQGDKKESHFYYPGKVSREGDDPASRTV